MMNWDKNMKNMLDSLENSLNLVKIMYKKTYSILTINYRTFWGIKRVL